MQHSKNIKAAKDLWSCYTVDWDSKPWNKNVEQWLNIQPVHTWNSTYQKNGFLVVENLISHDEVKIYQDIYSKIIDGDIDCTSHRHDLGNHVERKRKTENICQIMWPRVFLGNIEEGPLHMRSEAVAKIIMGEDAVLDFDMLIFKAPHTNTETPWHQDLAYRPELKETRESSCWVALDESTVDNGCMWFVPGSHLKPIRKHSQVKQYCHSLVCECSDEEGIAIPLKPGSCTFHSGGTLHHTKGNSTDKQRRAYINNFKPLSVIEQQCELGIDYGMVKGADAMLNLFKEGLLNSKLS